MRGRDPLLPVLGARAGLPPIRLHDLRDGAATLALAAGVDIDQGSDLELFSGSEPSSCP